jgi:hypothetical protein
MIGSTSASWCQLRSTFLYQLMLAVNPVDSKAETKTASSLSLMRGSPSGVPALARLIIAIPG